MKPLIDADILLHEIGWSTEFKDKETKKQVLLDFDMAQELVDNKIRMINAEVEATEEPILFFSDSEKLTESINRENRLYQNTPRIHIPNFRFGRAKTRPYKAGRNQPKPFHFNNILSYLRAEYSCIISEGGLEADDELGIYQSQNSGTIICSRDKDLRMIPGYHYSWECGKQESLGPEYTDDLGKLYLNHKNKVVGYGSKFFYFQMLVGDVVDNIPGLPRCGEVTAFNSLKDLHTIYSCYDLVKNMYKLKFGDKAQSYFLEQADLLWIHRDRSKGYEYPK